MLVWNHFDMPGQRHLLPVTAAIRRALALPADTIIRTAIQPPTDMVAMEVVIYRMVASAIAGDTKAIALIADRVEGRVGLRSDAAEPDEPARRQRVQAAIEALVRFMADGRRKRLPWARTTRWGQSAMSALASHADGDAPDGAERLETDKDESVRRCLRVWSTA